MLIRDLAQRYPQFSHPTVWRHATKTVKKHLSRKQQVLLVSQNYQILMTE